MYSILEKKLLAQKTTLFIVSAKKIAEKAEPGQFVVLRIEEQGERIPLTIADTDTVKGTISLVVQNAGYTTAKLTNLREGDSIPDIAGPLGRPTAIENIGTIAGVAGGIGIAALYPIIKRFKEQGATTISILGARSKNFLFWEKRMHKVSDDFYITTDDGSYGKKGLVTAPLKELIQKHIPIDEVFAVGPTIMMKAVADTTLPYNIHTVASLNPIMLDGTGMCGSCRVEVGGKTKFACVDGPDFNAHKVDFNLLLIRQKIYSKQEKQILN